MSTFPMETTMRINEHDIAFEKTGPRLWYVFWQGPSCSGSAGPFKTKAAALDYARLMVDPTTEDLKREERTFAML